MNRNVLRRLKPKIIPLGFNEKELQEVAGEISDKLNSENATDEEIDTVIDEDLRFLSLAQTARDKVIEKACKNDKLRETKDNYHPSNSKPLSNNDEPEWFRNYLTDLFRIGKTKK